MIAYVGGGTITKGSYIELDDDSSPNFLGHHMSVEEFQNTDFSQDEDESLAMGGMQL